MRSACKIIITEITNSDMCN